MLQCTNAKRILDELLRIHSRIHLSCTILGHAGQNKILQYISSVMYRLQVHQQTENFPFVYHLPDVLLNELWRGDFCQLCPRFWTHGGGDVSAGGRRVSNWVWFGPTRQGSNGISILGCGGGGRGGRWKGEGGTTADCSRARGRGDVEAVRVVSFIRVGH